MCVHFHMCCLTCMWAQQELDTDWWEPSVRGRCWEMGCKEGCRSVSIDSTCHSLSGCPVVCVGINLGILQIIVSLYWSTYCHIVQWKCVIDGDLACLKSYLKQEYIFASEIFCFCYKQKFIAIWKHAAAVVLFWWIVMPYHICYLCQWGKKYFCKDMLTISFWTPVDLGTSITEVAGGGFWL